MRRDEWFLTLILCALILAGVIYGSYRGAGKTADVIITHSGATPFDAELFPAAVPTAQSFTNQAISQSTPPAIRSNQNGFLLFLNRASESQFEEIHGIGKVLAKRIVEYRTASGPFTHVEQLLEVSGIGEAKYRDIQQHFTQMRTSLAPIEPTAVPYRTLRSIAPNQQISPNHQGAQSHPLSLNRATRDELTAVSGIGPALADAILKERNQKRKFHSWSEVRAISGIGEQRLQTLKNHFTLP